MEALLQARPFILTAFFLALGIVAIGAFIDTMMVLQAGSVIAHCSLFLFVLTESFGRVSKKRNPFSRILARVFLVLSGLVIASFFVNLLLVPFSS